MRKGSVVRQVLLLQLALGQLIDLLHQMGVLPPRILPKKPGVRTVAKTCSVVHGVVIEDAGHQSDDHGDDGGPDDEGEENLVARLSC